ncbi:hypothetical protein H2200_012549 [Cladophialophora chaetospira]|uniref:Cytochrome P450 n=1 Tax=Cladophialophora chaetospira TaxID=386627 RepID=A0AA38WX58_9EURO|nr:hypothetical protein H2200_012549 [Cladophialophora chaetospira]
MFVILRAIYRLTLHPLAKFPGPFWARITSIYGMSYDLTNDRGTNPKWIESANLGEGPIIRTHPHVLHVRDLDSYNQIFRAMTPFDKHRDQYQAKFTEGFFNIGSSKVVKPYKDVYQPYFSKSSITRMEPLIHETLNTFLGKLDSASKEDGKVVDLTFGFRCLTSDTIMRYCFADEGFQTLESKEFRSPLIVKLEQFFDTIMPIIYFPKTMTWLTNQLGKLSDATQDKVAPGLAATNYIMDECKKKITTILENGGSQSTFPTIFDSWADQSKRKTEWIPSIYQLTCDAFTMFAAGTDTTAHTLTIGTWYLMKNPTMLAKLRNELRTAIPNPDSNSLKPAWELEKLPYLNGIVKESIRLGYGVPGRLARKVPAGGAIFHDQRAPAGYAICSTAYSIHMNESYFANAPEFQPERWLGDDKLELDKKLVSFSRGTRSCLGMNMAYAEMYLTFAYLFSRFDLKPTRTVAEDIEGWKDCFLPRVRKHLEVTISPATD